MPDETFFLVRSDILPETMMKVVEAKELLETRQVETVGEAVKRVGLKSERFLQVQGRYPPF